MNFIPCEQIWRVLDNHLCHLLLMVSYDCPLAIRHKKGEYIWREDFVARGSFCVLELWSFRLFLGASSCIYIFWLMMYFCFV